MGNAPRWVKLIAAAGLVVMAGCVDPQETFRKEAAACARDFDTTHGSFQSTATEMSMGNYELQALCVAAAYERSFPNDAGARLLTQGRITWARQLDRGEITKDEAELRTMKLEFDVRSQAVRAEAARTAALLLLLGR